MAKKQIKIWVELDTLDGLKKGAAIAGQSLSATAAELIRQGLENRSENSPDTGSLLSEIRNEIGGMLPRILDQIRESGGTSRKSLPETDARFSWTTDQAKYLVGTTAQIVEFLIQFNKIYGGDYGDRARHAYKISESVPKDLIPIEFGAGLTWTREQAVHLVGTTAAMECYASAINKVLNKDNDLRRSEIERVAKSRFASEVEKYFPEE